MPFTSTLGSSLSVEGLELQVGTAGSPGSFITIANVDNFSEPVIEKLVEVTNVGDHWIRRRPTLNDMGKIAFQIFWIPQEPTHENVSGGLRYMLVNQVLADWQVLYPDGITSPTSMDSFPAYVSSFAITGKTGDVFRAACDLANDGAPTLI
jgi:hypothetical protein